MSTHKYLFRDDINWPRVTDYYYDHVKWIENLGLNQWLKQEFGLTHNLTVNRLDFDTEAQKAWFVLRWA
jgi:hypothetical protein